MGDPTQSSTHSQPRRWRRVISFILQSTRNISGTYRRGDWVGPRASLDAVAMIQNPPESSSNRTLVVRAVASRYTILIILWYTTLYRMILNYCPGFRGL
jgi:hypothetical protein